MDGNFKLAPNIFSQLYIVRILSDSAVTCLALLSGKTQAIYEMFHRIKRKCQEFGFNLDLSTIIANFELVRNIDNLISFMIAYWNDIEEYILTS